MNEQTGRLWTEYHRSLLAFINKRVGDRSDAEDILQDVFARIHARMGGLRDDERLQAWIYRIARNTIVDHYRGRAREQREMAQRMTVSPDDSDAHTAETELADCLRPLLDDLPPDYREAVKLTEMEGLTQKAAATHVGLSLSGMKSRVQRGRARLREKLLECCHVELDRRGSVVDYEVKDCSVCGSGDHDDVWQPVTLRPGNLRDRSSRE